MTFFTWKYLVWYRVKAQPILRSSSWRASTARDSFKFGSTSLFMAPLISVSVMALNLALKMYCQIEKEGRPCNVTFKSCQQACKWKVKKYTRNIKKTAVMGNITDLSNEDKSCPFSIRTGSHHSSCKEGLWGLIEQRFVHATSNYATLYWSCLMWEFSTSTTRFLSP